MVALSHGNRPQLHKSHSAPHGMFVSVPRTTLATCATLHGDSESGQAQLSDREAASPHATSFSSAFGDRAGAGKDTPECRPTDAGRDANVSWRGSHAGDQCARRCGSESVVGKTHEPSCESKQPRCLTALSGNGVVDHGENYLGYSTVKDSRCHPVSVSDQPEHAGTPTIGPTAGQAGNRLLRSVAFPLPLARGDGRKGVRKTLEAGPGVTSPYRISPLTQTAAGDLEMEFQHQDSLGFVPFPTSDPRLVRRSDSLGFEPGSRSDSLAGIADNSSLSELSDLPGTGARRVSLPVESVAGKVNEARCKDLSGKLRYLKRLPILRDKTRFRRDTKTKTTPPASSATKSTTAASPLTDAAGKDFSGKVTRSTVRSSPSYCPSDAPQRFDSRHDRHPPSVARAMDTVTCACFDNDEEDDMCPDLNCPLNKCAGVSSHTAVSSANWGSSCQEADPPSKAGPGRWLLSTPKRDPSPVAMETDSENAQRTKDCGFVCDARVDGQGMGAATRVAGGQHHAIVGRSRSSSGSTSAGSNPPVPPFCRQLSRRRSHRRVNASQSLRSGSGSSVHNASDTPGNADNASDTPGNADNDDVFVEELRGEREEEDQSYTPPGSPRAKVRRLDSEVDIEVDNLEEMWNNDPYQVFQVQHLPCLILTVRVIQGRNITYGWKDIFDTPDPYVKLRLMTAPEGRQRTRTIDNNSNPEWNETFTFCLDAQKSDNILEISLMEANYPASLDQEIGKANFDVFRQMKVLDNHQTEIFNFSGTLGRCEIELELHMNWDTKPTLRYSLCLSDAEKEFNRKRKPKVMEALNKFLGDEFGPKTLKETPTIAVIGSGGGFRAMTGYSGVFKALAESGLLACTTLAGGLSGSSWYLSTLYSHPGWPEMSPGAMQSELMNNIDKSLMRLLGPQSLMRYVNSVISKRQQGQPVSFTDFFGHMVGETLLKGRQDCRLSDQREKLRDGDVPLPLYTCVHVKKDVSAKSFQEWVEFSPYEIGMPKYGTFMDSEQFGCKFFMGKLVKQYPEPPLHFLQGIWGSAFCILFKRLLDDNRNMDPVEMVRQEMARELNEEAGILHSEDSCEYTGDDSSDDDEDVDVDVDVDDEKLVIEESNAARDINVNMEEEEEEENENNCKAADYHFNRERRDCTKGDKQRRHLPSFFPFAAQRGMGQGSLESLESSERSTSFSDGEESSSEIQPPSSFLQPQQPLLFSQRVSQEDEVDSGAPACRVRNQSTTLWAGTGSEDQGQMPACRAKNQSTTLWAGTGCKEQGQKAMPHRLSHKKVIGSSNFASPSQVHFKEPSSPNALYTRSLSSSPSSWRKPSLSFMDGGAHVNLACSLNAGVRKGLGVRFSDSVDQREEQKARESHKRQDEATQRPQPKRHPGGVAGRSHVTRTPALRNKSFRTQQSLSRRSMKRSFWSSLLKGLFESQNIELLNTCAGRAAVIHNFMRGLNLQQSYPLSPFTPVANRVKEGDEFDGIFEMHPTHVKHIYMVDAGLTFNSPYPLVLRPQREVDVILSFDFSARHSDSSPPFKELLLAEKWARLNRLPFPHIDPKVVDREGMKELYIFQDKDDPHCPVVLHFPLVNIDFRKYKAPGVKRKTEEELKFADFDLFDDPKTPYSTFNFTYSHDDFRRLSQLTEFNTLHSLDRIKRVLQELVVKKRTRTPRITAQSRQAKLLRMQSVKKAREMKKYLRKLSGNFTNCNSSGPSPSTDTSSALPSLSSTPPSAFFTAEAFVNNMKNPFSFNAHDTSLSSSSSSFSSSSSSSPSGGKRYNLGPEDGKRDKQGLEDSVDDSSQENPFFVTNRKQDKQGLEDSVDDSSQENQGLEDSVDDSSQENPFFVTNRQNSQNPTSTEDETPEAGDWIENPFFAAWKQDRETTPRTPHRPGSPSCNREAAGDGSNSESVMIQSSTSSQIASGFPPVIVNTTATGSKQQRRSGSVCRVATSDSVDWVFCSLSSTPPSPSGTSLDVLQQPHNSDEAMTRPSSQQPSSSWQHGEDTSHATVATFSRPNSELSRLNASFFLTQTPETSPPVDAAATTVGYDRQTPSVAATDQGTRAKSLCKHRPLPTESHSSSDDEFYDAAEAITRDGVPVTDQQLAKKHQERAKSLRKLWRRQSTVSSLNSISLECPEDQLLSTPLPPPSRNSSCALSDTGSDVIPVSDLQQFEGVIKDFGHDVGNDQALR